MSIIITENQGYNTALNMDYFDEASTSNFNDEELLHEAPSLSTPPPKRRRGRPPKVFNNLNGEPSPAANLSAAVMKQGTPKASAPLMRISPVKSKGTSNTSPLQNNKVNPSPKGGLLMKLDSGVESKVRSTKKGSPKYLSRAPGTKTPKQQQRVNFYDALSPSKISLGTQQNIHSLTSSTTNEKASSVNPSLLLSSPISSTKKIREFSKSRIPNFKKSKIVEKTNMNPPSIANIASSPMTPNSLSSSSCFSSIMQSSPLYHGYYANNSSPNTSIMNSSPVRFQMKAIEVQKLGKELSQLPRNPVNSPDLKAQSKSTLSIIPEKSSLSSPNQETKSSEQYKIHLSIDESGQAKITKVKNSKPQATRRPFTRHESLINVNNYGTRPALPVQRSLSLGDIHKGNTHSTTETGIAPQTEVYEMFIEPSKMSKDSFFSDISDEFELISSTSENGFDLLQGEPFSKEEHFNDERLDYDARKALIKMIRRSV